MIKFEINQKIGQKINRKKLDKIIKKANQILRLKKDYSFSLAIVSDKEIKKLNKIYRKKDKSTDVLSFSFAESKSKDFKPKNKIIDLGEIIISFQTAQKQAREAGYLIENEICRLLVHGLLHLFGYNHIKKGDSKIMEKLESKILAESKLSEYPPIASNNNF